MATNQTSIIYDHYKDTCSVIGDAVRRRDRTMLFVIIALGFFAFHAISPSTTDIAITEYLSFKFGLTTIFDLSVLGNVVWVLVLLFSLRYFQTSVFVERQYAYIHQLEDKVNKSLGEETITREGKSYLSDYPWFSDWMWVIYTIILPILLFIVSLVKIVNEWVVACGRGYTFGLYFNTGIFLLLIISIALYLGMLHTKKK